MSLIAAAVVGFGGGAVIASNGGDENDPQSVSTDTPAGGETPDPTASAETQASEGGITLQSPLTAAAPGQEIPLTGSIEPAAGDVILTVQRDLGDGWQTYGNTPVTATTRADGSFQTTIAPTRTGAAQFRVIGQVGGLEATSNPVPITIG